ncbi:MAG: hypothetical protein WAM07_16295, partial [Halobacillus sp.]
DFVFGVHVQEGWLLPETPEVLGDEYELGKKAYKKFQALKPILSDLESLGFERLRKEAYVHYDKYYGTEIPVQYDLHLHKDFTGDKSMFKKNWEKPYFQLVKIVQESNAGINSMWIEGRGEDPRVIVINDISEIESKEQLVEYMIRDNNFIEERLFSLEMEGVFGVG